MHPMLNVAIKAARLAGKLITRAADNLDVLTVRHKSLNDLVSEVDRAAEDVIIETLKKTYADHSILAEESGASGSSDYQWIIDPLDGTTNFLHGFPHYAVSIGVLFKGVPAHGVIYDPTRNELYTASRGTGAFLNDRRLRVSKRDKLIDGLISTGFPFRMFEHVDAYSAMLKDMMQKCAGVRRPGAASLDLAAVAAGRFDGFWEVGLAPWDMAAGVLMITEAGGLVGDFEGNEKFMERGQIVAANPKLFSQIIQLLQPHLTPSLRGKTNERSTAEN